MGRETAEDVLTEIETHILNEELTKKDLKYIVKRLNELIERGKIEVTIAD